MKKSSLWKTSRDRGLSDTGRPDRLLVPANGRAIRERQGGAGQGGGECGRNSRVLNPEAQLPEVDTKALSPRLSSFAGKTIVIFDNRGGYEKPMRGLADQLKPLLPPDTKFVYYTPTTTTWTAADQAKIPLGDAAIVGHAY